MTGGPSQKAHNVISYYFVIIGHTRTGDDHARDAQGDERYLLCQFPGYSRRIAYSGKGRPPAYCGQTIGGVPHTRLTVHRMNRR
ncbi:hypothetical protein GCM10023317_16330 [Actinopolymorpha pittospori]